LVFRPIMFTKSLSGSRRLLRLDRLNGDLLP
jgi:hypothetical protein